MKTARFFTVLYVYVFCNWSLLHDFPLGYRVRGQPEVIFVERYNNGTAKRSLLQPFVPSPVSYLLYVVKFSRSLVMVVCLQVTLWCNS